ncbi:hypothetical protein SY88_05280 [Clostridiales bacterium PH28_bin88]|nr:hypothetical protein SY88_05280 [Clostridiales bacterium PH28_bin88]
MLEAKGIKPIVPRLQLEILSSRDIIKIHEAALEVMEEVGVHFPSDKALNVLEEAGCTVDRSTRVAKLPARLVMQYMRKAPSRYVLAGRDPKNDLFLDANTCYLSTDGCGIQVMDIDTGEIRRSTKQDVERACIAADYLDEVAYVWGPPVSAQDVPAHLRPLHELEACMLGTAKHIQPETVISEPVARYTLKMAALVAGGMDNLRRRPIFSFMQCATDPLGQDGGSLEASMVAAEYGIPTGFMPMPMSCATAPATLAGNLVVTTVDAVSPLVLMQIINPGTPVYFAAAPTAIDLRTGGYTGGGPEDFLLGGAFNQICQFYNIPLSMGTMATGAKEPDWQAGVDNAFSTMMPVLTRTAILTGAGMLNGSKIFSFQQLLMDCEIYNIAKQVAEGIEVNDETLALDVIKKVGPRGSYLAEKHTRRHMKDIWRPAVYDRTPYETWLAGGKQGAFATATGKAKWILENHRPLPLEDGILEEFAGIMAEADQVLGARQ